MKKHVLQTVFAACIFLFCAVYLVLALQMPFGRVEKPNFGFVPTVMGLIGVLLSLGILIKSLIGQKLAEKIEDFTKSGLLRVAGYMITILAFISLFEVIGYAIVFPILFILSKISGMQGWVFPTIMAGSITLFSYIMFVYLLGVPMPAGIFG